MPDREKVLLVAGSRNIHDWLNYGHVVHLLDNLSYTHDVKFDKIIHGGARGVDQAGGEWARMKGYEVQVYPADWDRLGKRAGFERNTQMAHACTHACVIWDGESKGTKMMIDLLTNMKIPTAIRIIGYPEWLGRS